MKTSTLHLTPCADIRPFFDSTRPMIYRTGWQKITFIIRTTSQRQQRQLACVANIIAGAWHLPSHRHRDPEDNLISMSMVMFSTLSAIGNIVALFGICLRRPGNLQLSIVFNSVFIVCIFLVAVVTCVFRMEKFLELPENIALIVLALISGAVYSLYYLTVVNSLYRTMKMSYGDSAIPI